MCSSCYIVKNIKTMHSIKNKFWMRYIKQLIVCLLVVFLVVIILTAVLLASTLIYFQVSGQMGHLSNRFFGIDKILFGQLLGTFVIIAANYSYQSIKQKLGRTPFPYAKVVFPFGAILLTTVFFKIFFLIINRGGSYKE